MKQVCRSALVPFDAAQMFKLINDIESYPEFLPWCSQAEVFADSYDPGASGEVRAALTIKRSRMQERFETLNRAKFPEQINVKLLQGPFRHLEGTWVFVPLGELGCKTKLTLNYEMSGTLLDGILAGVVKKTVNSVVDAIVERAHKLYG